MEKQIRIGVYTICKNESKFVRKWLESMYCNGKGADRAYVLDTGSADNTVQLFKDSIKSLGIPEDWLKLETTTYEQFRFDTGRNDNLKMIPDSDELDALVEVDLDETMIEDFWPDVRAVIAEHPDFQRIHYLYAWNHDNDGRPKRVFWYDKVHPAKNCHWIHPVHEILVVDDPTRKGTYRLNKDKIYLHHWADATKGRGYYLDLLELRSEESPDDIYGLFYLMREYTFHDKASIKALNAAIRGYTKILSSGMKDTMDCLPFFTLAMADIYKNLGLKEDAEFYYKRALEFAPHLRQPYISYASFAAYNGKHELALHLLDDMEKNSPTKYSTWYECDYNWTWKPLQIKAVALCWAAKYREAGEVFREALSKYILTDVDRAEARSNGFYADYDWLKDYLRKARRMNE